MTYKTTPRKYKKRRERECVVARGRKKKPRRDTQENIQERKVDKE